MHDGQQPQDHAADLRLARSRLARGIYLSLGLVCVGAGVIGLFLPGWPTTIWLLIAAWLFSRSSPRFYGMILNHKVFGPIVRDYRAGNGVPVRIKLIAAGSIVVFAGLSVVFLISNHVVQLVVVGVGMFGCGFMFGLPTRRPYEEFEPAQAHPAPLMTNDSISQ